MIQRCTGPSLHATEGEHVALKLKKQARRPRKRPAHLDESSTRPCDDYIDDLAAPEALRKYLAFARAPAHGLLLPKPHPTLFADFEGTRVRVTMASLFGDVGITTDFDRELGYDRRVSVSQLSNFSEAP